MEGDIHCLLGWVGALARPSPAIFRNYRSVNPGITMTALGRVSRASPVQTAVRNCTRDEGRSFEIGSQVLVSNHCKLLSSKAMVVSVAANVGTNPSG